MDQVNLDLLSVDETHVTGRAIIQVDENTGDNAILLFPGSNQLITRQDVEAIFSKSIFKFGDFAVFQNEVSSGDVAMELAYKIGILEFVIFIWFLI